MANPFIGAGLIARSKSANLELARQIIADPVDTDLNDPYRGMSWENFNIPFEGQHQSPAFNYPLWLTSADILGPLVSQSGSQTVTPELKQLAKNYIDAESAGEIGDKVRTPGLWDKIGGGVLTTIGGLVGGPVGAAAVGAGVGGTDGGLAGALKGGLMGFAGGSLLGPTNFNPNSLGGLGGLSNTISGGIFNAGQGALNFLDPVIPDFIRAPGGAPGGTPRLPASPDFIEGIDTGASPGFRLPATPNFIEGIEVGSQGPRLSTGSPRLIEGIDTGIGVNGVSGTGLPPGGIWDTIKGLPSTTSLADIVSLASTGVGLTGLAGSLGAFGSPETLEGDGGQPIFAPGTFQETAPIPGFRTGGQGAPGAVTLSRAAFEKASPFRQSILQNAISTGQLVLT